MDVGQAEKDMKDTTHHTTDWGYRGIERWRVEWSMEDVC